MDSFTENLLTRARERQKLLQHFNDVENHGKPNTHMSEPNLNSVPISKSRDKMDSPLKNVSEGNIPKLARQTSSTRISSEFKNSKTLNIQKENFNMEIKLRSADNVRVEVQIEEEDDENNDLQSVGLRKDTKHRLDRLAKLCTGGDDADISSPIHRTEDKFIIEKSPTSSKSENIITKRGLTKLADLAQSITQFEDEFTPIRIDKEDKRSKAKKSFKKTPAPQPPHGLCNPVKQMDLIKPTEANLENIEGGHNIKWDKNVLDSLGFIRTDSSSRLVYKYDINNQKENRLVSPTKKHAEISNSSPSRNHVADTAALFEQSACNKTLKDPALLSVSERKALFEKNKGTPLIPKAPFAMPTPAKDLSRDVKNINSPRQQSPIKESLGIKVGGIANKVAALFENKTTISQEQIEKNIQEQRTKEMEVLLNRFNKPNECITEENESFEDNEEDSTEATAMIHGKSSKIVTSKEERRSGGNKRCSKSDSPKVAAVLNEVKRIKVSPNKSGRLYPSLTDIESVTETETRSPSPNTYNTSSDNSIAGSDDANTSFGRDILQVVCKNEVASKNQILDESTASELSDVLDDMDDYIDEALAFNDECNEGPTPPKQGKKSPIEPSHSFNYKNFSMENQNVKYGKEDLPTHVVDGDNVLPLTHTVSFYRKQQTQATCTTPIKQISRQAVDEHEPEHNANEIKLIEAKIDELKNEIAKQEMIISQTSQALNLCNSTLEFMGSTEQVEADRVLLVATHRRQAAMHERQRLEVEQSLRPKRKFNDLPVQRGTMKISKIVLPLKQKYVTALAAAGGKGHHVVCLIKYGTQVIPTQLVSTIVNNSKNFELELNIPGTVTLKDVYNDATFTFEVYCLQAQEEILPHEVKYHIKKSNVKSTPKKSKQDSRLVRPMKESPAGPQVVRSPTFALMGYVVFTMPSAINKKCWSLNNTPSMSPLEGVVEMLISCELDISVEHRGFLTMFEDVSGFGAWHRRWCLLRGHTLNYWKYPDDEKKTTPVGSICLRDSITEKVGPVTREICARLHTFLVEIERDAMPYDKESLVTVCRGPRTIIRHLLSADTKEERLEWCEKFNIALSAINMNQKKF